MKFRLSRRVTPLDLNQSKEPHNLKPRPVISSPIPINTLRTPIAPHISLNTYASFDHAFQDFGPPYAPQDDNPSSMVPMTRECSIFELSPERLLLLPGPEMENNRTSRIQRRSHVPPEAEYICIPDEPCPPLPRSVRRTPLLTVRATLLTLPDEVLDYLCATIRLQLDEHGCDRVATRELYYLSLVNHKVHRISTRHIYHSLRIRTGMELESSLTSLLRFPLPDKEVKALHLMVDCRPYDALALSSSFAVLDEHTVRLLMHLAPSLVALHLDVFLGSPEIPWNAPYIAFYREIALLKDFVNTRDSHLTLLNPYGAAFLPWTQWKSLERLALIDQYVDAAFASAILALPALTHLVLGCPSIQLPPPSSTTTDTPRPALPFDTLLRDCLPSTSTNAGSGSAPSDSSQPPRLRRIIFVTWRHALGLYARQAQLAARPGLSVITVRPLPANGRWAETRDADVDRDEERAAVGSWIRHAAEDGTLWGAEDLSVPCPCGVCGVCGEGAGGGGGGDDSVEEEEEQYEGAANATFELHVTEAD